DVYFIDINLDGSVQIRANNVVGGLVGQLTGNSGIYNVSSNLNVKAGKDSEYSTPYSSSGFAEKQENAEMCPLSYAGGIAGIVDINKNEKSYVNVNKINVASSNVEGGRVGGIAGYFGSGVTSSRLTYVINNDSNIIGRFVAGGIVGDNCGDIELSQINGATIEAQYNYDNEFAKYINDNVATKLDTENSNYGNLSALQGDNVVGGFIGINYGGNVKNSLTKANIGAHPSYGVAKTIGGFVGISYGGDFQYSYSQNYIDLTYNIQNDVGDVVEYSRARVIGGFAGEIDYEGNVEGSTHIGLDNVMVVTWFDESEVANAEVMQGNCSCLDEACDKQHSITLDYIVGAYDSTNVTPRLNKNSTGGAIINFAHYNYVDEESNNEGAEGGTENTPEDFVAMHISTGNANKIVKSESEYRFDIHELYNTAISKNLFEELFLPWPFEVWQLDHTKFLPNLKEDNSTDYIQLYTKDDLKYFELFPDRNFILMNDIDVGDVLGNYVVPIDFSGILVGNLQDQGNYAKFKNITLYANSNNAYGDGAG
ncbi:MAG: hypothetical protein IJA72_04735, partial [Clostridia bacterium]|nr:hypothetical protein [Clostridia bacterium]